MKRHFRGLAYKAYYRLCGQELSANFLHFQFLPSYYFRRDLRQDGGRLQGRLLDVGCGNQPYRALLTGVKSYIGLDYPVTQAIQDFQSRPEVYGDARRLPFADASFDAVLCAQVLEHVDRPQQVLREIGRVLKPGGCGILSAPFIYNLHVEPYDFFRFSPFGLRTLLEGAGLKVRAMRCQGGIGTAVVQLLHNWAISGMARLARRRRALAGVFALAAPLLLLGCAANNLAALGLDKLAPGRERFAPNLWVVFAKE
jgi:SAM-dependent methyltransferase